MGVLDCLTLGSSRSLRSRSRPVAGESEANLVAAAATTSTTTTTAQLQALGYIGVHAADGWFWPLKPMVPAVRGRSDSCVEVAVHDLRTRLAACEEECFLAFAKR